MSSKGLIIDDIVDFHTLAVITNSPIGTRYDQLLDRESAFEALAKRGAQEKAAAEELQVQEATERPAPGRHADSPLQAMFKSAMRSVGSSLGRNLVRGVLGGLLGGKKRW